MSKSAVTGRLRAMAHLLDERGFVRKGVDMSPSAVMLRLRTMASLSDMCRRLASATLRESARDLAGQVVAGDRR